MFYNKYTGADGEQVSRKVYEIKWTMYPMLLKYTYTCMLGFNSVEYRVSVECCASDFFFFFF